MSKTSKQKRLQEIEDQMQLESRESDLNRARSLGVATAFTQVTEISLRGNGDRFLWTILQPAEVVELIHQLAGNIGCHINVRPREDFASWRKWNGESSDFLPSSTHPPQMGVFPPKAEVEFNKQIGCKLTETTEEQKDVVATEKTVNKRKSKSARTSSK